MPSNVPQPSHLARRRIAVAGVALLSVVALASHASFGVSGSLSVPEIDRSESRAAHEELVQARRAYTRASVAHLVAIRRASSDVGFGNRPRAALDGVVEAPIDSARLALELNVAQAIARFETVRRPLLDSVHAKPDYRALSDARADIRRALNALIASGAASDTAMIDLARRALDIGSQMTRAEILALSQDRNVEDARLAMTTSFARLRQYVDVQHVATGMPSRFDQLPAPTPTQSELDAARERVEAADRRLADALMREAALEQVRQMRIKKLRVGPPISPFGH